MKLVRSPNAWSCPLATAAMVFDYDIEDFMLLIGHNGYKKIHPQLPSPACYKGFHMQEIVDAALVLGYSMTLIEAQPVQTPDGVAKHVLTKFPRFNNHVDRFVYYVNTTKGLLVGKTRQWWHTCAYDHGTVYDPRGRVCPLEELPMILHSLWIVSEKSNQPEENSA